MIDSILANNSLEGINVVHAEIHKINSVRASVYASADDILTRGLNNQNQADLFESLAVFYHLNQLAPRVQSVVDHSLALLLETLQNSLDVASINRGKLYSNPESAASSPVAGVRRITESMSNSSVTEFGNNLWKRMEVFVDQIFAQSSQIYALDRALSRKKDPESGLFYAEFVSKSEIGCVIAYFWKSLSATFDKELKAAVKSSQLFQLVMQINYPKLLRMFRGLFSNISISHNVSSDGVDQDDHTLILKPLAQFENIYLGKSLTRLLEPVNAAFSSLTPSRDHVDKISRVISSELEISKFDALLLKRVCKNVKKSLDSFASKCEDFVDRSEGYNFSGTVTASLALQGNIEIINCVYRVNESVWLVIQEYQGECPVVLEIIGKSLDVLLRLIFRA